MPLRLETQFTNLHMLCRTSHKDITIISLPFPLPPLSYISLSHTPLYHPFPIYPISIYHIPIYPFPIYHFPIHPIHPLPHIPLPHTPLLYTPLLPRALNDAYNFSTLLQYNFKSFLSYLP